MESGYVAIHSRTANVPNVPEPTTHRSWQTFLGVSSPKLIFDDTDGSGPTGAPIASSNSSDEDDEASIVKGEHIVLRLLLLI